jgi:hypothetical protein
VGQISLLVVGVVVLFIPLSAPRARNHLVLAVSADLIAWDTMLFLALSTLLIGWSPAVLTVPCCWRAPHTTSLMLSASSTNKVSLTSAVFRVHAAAATFGLNHELAAREYTETLLSDESGAAESDMLSWEVLLFDGPVEEYDALLRAMNTLQRLVNERSVSEADSQARGRLFRLVTGLNARIDEAVAEVRQQAGTYGSPHARAAVEWTDRVVNGRGLALGGPTNAAMLELRVPLFDECTRSELPAAFGGVDLSEARCEELRASLAALAEVWARSRIAEARGAPRAEIKWSSGEPMPPQFAAWGCNEKLWVRVENKRALVRLANSVSGEARFRIRLEKLRALVEEEAAEERRLERANRRAVRTGGAPPHRPVAGSRATGKGSSKTKTSTRRDSPKRTLVDDAALPSVAQPQPLPAPGPGREGVSDAYIQQIPPLLLACGCDEALWRRVKNKNALRRLARLGDEEHARKRIANLRENLAREEESQ